MGLSKIEARILLELGENIQDTLDMLEATGLNDKQLERLHEAQQKSSKLNSLLREA